MAPHIGEQLPEMDAENAEQFDRDAQSICRLFVRGLLTVAERQRAEKRLVKMIPTEIKRA
jgi:hypothetical protein